MTIIGHNWLNAQATRQYPLDDSASGVSDDGTILKDDVLVDAHLRWPKLAGQYAFLGGLTVTPRIITAVFLAADSPTAASNFTPLASITIQQPVTRHRYYNVEPLYPGVGGFVAFGDTQEAFTARFSNPFQSLLAPKVGRPYDDLPIPTIRKLGRSDALTGLVKLLPGPDIQIVKEDVEIEGETREAIVIRLVGATTTNSAILSKYIGPCGVRPESRNCTRDGIETINGVAPDCDGNLNIRFRGFLTTPFEDCGAGVVIDQNLGIGDVCAAQDIQRFEGIDLCGVTSSLSIYDPDPDPSSASVEPDPSESVTSEESSEAAPCEELPFADCFFPTLHHSWVNRGGDYRMVNTPTLTEVCLQDTICVDYFSGSSSLSSLESISASSSFSSSSSLSSSSSSSSDSEVVASSSLSLPLDSSVSSVYVPPGNGEITVEDPDGESMSSSAFYDMGDYTACRLDSFQIINTGEGPLELYQFRVNGVVPNTFEGDPCGSAGDSIYVPCVEVDYNIATIINAFNRGEARIDDNRNICSGMYGPNNCGIATLASNATTGRGDLVFTGLVPNYRYYVEVVLATSPYSTNDRLSQMRVTWGGGSVSLAQYDGNGIYRARQTAITADANGEILLALFAHGTNINTDASQRVRLESVVIRCEPHSQSSSISESIDSSSSVSSSAQPSVSVPGGGDSSSEPGVLSSSSSLSSSAAIIPLDSYPLIELYQGLDYIDSLGSYDFGSLSEQVEVTFIVLNTGTAPLSLDAGEVSE